MHVYQPNSFTLEQENLLRSTAGPSRYFENFLTEEEFEQCRNLVLGPIDWPEHGEVSKYWGFGWDSGLGPQISWLKDKIDGILDGWELDFLAVQEGITPWMIHADIRWYPDKIPYKVILMPMDVEPMSGPVPVNEWPDTHSITFHQRSFLAGWKTFKHDGPIPTDTQNHWFSMRPGDNPNHEGLVEGYQITREQWQKYFNHMPYECMEGVSIEAIHKWKPRSLFFWDNTALHCADNFLGNNIRTKRCLMLFTVLKK